MTPARRIAHLGQKATGTMQQPIIHPGSSSDVRTSLTVPEQSPLVVPSVSIRLVPGRKARSLTGIRAQVDDVQGEEASLWGMSSLNS